MDRLDQTNYEGKEVIEMKEYEFRLIRSGGKDTVALRRSFDYMKEQMRVASDSDVKIIDYIEYAKLVEDDRIEKPKSYWQIEKDEVGIIVGSYYSQYTSSWEKCWSCFGDFKAGWLAKEKIEG